MIDSELPHSSMSATVAQREGRPSRPNMLGAARHHGTVPCFWTDGATVGPAARRAPLSDRGLGEQQR